MTLSLMKESGFAEIRISPVEAPVLMDMMRNRIRRLSHLDASGKEVFAEVSRLARLCFVLAGGEPGEWVTLGRLSREDVDAMYVLDHGVTTQQVLESLNSVRDKVRSTGPVDLDVSDQAAKSVIEVLET